MAKKELRRQARNLRKKGKTYQQIREVIPVSKSTLSLWLRDLPTPQRTCSGQPSIGEVAKKRWKRVRKDLLDEAVEEVASYVLDRNAVAFMGAALYWAEGQKKGAFNFANSDPFMVDVYLWWLRNIIKVDENEIRGHIHVYLDDGVEYKDILDFWVETTGIEKSCFYSPQIITADTKKTKAQHHKILKYGVIHIKVMKPLKYRAKCAALLRKIGKKTSFVKRNDLG